ncbi:hypothetical protein ND991_03615 [Gordonia sputi]|uniref:hypothetical protein n=1 Tax=Gordonia sputi TaxID=36823 RepID=UPI002042C8AC|nr:hypothetical protein [Gordonia sputi]MCM3894307.1 hypothetical protein [Gordonia sputi]
MINSTTTHRPIELPDDDLSQDVLLDSLAHVEPFDLDDLLALAELVGDVADGRLELQTVVV